MHSHDSKFESLKRDGKAPPFSAPAAPSRSETASLQTASCLSFQGYLMCMKVSASVQNLLLELERTGQRQSLPPSTLRDCQRSQSLVGVEYPPASPCPSTGHAHMGRFGKLAGLFLTPLQRGSCLQSVSLYK